MENVTPTALRPQSVGQGRRRKQGADLNDARRAIGSVCLSTAPSLRLTEGRPTTLVSADTGVGDLALFDLPLDAAATSAALAFSVSQTASGIESMSRASFVMPKVETAFRRNNAVCDTTTGWRFVNRRIWTCTGSTRGPKRGERRRGV
jgi:hypothetical protein